MAAVSVAPEVVLIASMSFSEEAVSDGTGPEEVMGRLRPGGQMSWGQTVKGPARLYSIAERIMKPSGKSRVEGLL